MIREENIKIDGDTFVSKGKNTPFDGREVREKYAVRWQTERVVYDEQVRQSMFCDSAENKEEERIDQQISSKN